MSKRVELLHGAPLVHSDFLVSKGNSPFPVSAIFREKRDRKTRKKHHSKSKKIRGYAKHRAPINLRMELYRTLLVVVDIGLFQSLQPKGHTEHSIEFITLQASRCLLLPLTVCLYSASGSFPRLPSRGSRTMSMMPRCTALS